MRILLVDDDTAARRRLLALLGEEPDAVVVEACAGGPAAAEAVRRHAPDLVLARVGRQEKGAGGGLEAVLDGEPRPLLVCVAASGRLAIPAFDAGALDCIVEPVRPARLRQALRRAQEGLEERRQRRRQPESAADAADAVHRVIIRNGKRLIVVSAEQIDWIESAGNYVVVHVGRDSHIMRDTLHHLGSRLPAAWFLRINRSAIVNLDRIRELRPNPANGFAVVLADGTQLPLACGIRDVQAWFERR